MDVDTSKRWKEDYEHGVKREYERHAKDMNKCTVPQPH